MANKAIQAYAWWQQQFSYDAFGIISGIAAIDYSRHDEVV